MTQNSSNSSKQDGNTKHPAKPNKQISPAKHWTFTWNNYGENDIDKICSNSSIKNYIFQEETGKEGTKHLQGYCEFHKKIRPRTIISDKIHWEKCRNIQASIEYCRKEDTRTGKMFTNMALPRVDTRLEKMQLNTWQQNLYNNLLEEPDDRTIIWIVDKVGGKGKSLFAKWLMWKHDDVCSMTMNKSADILTLVENYYKTYLIDLPRSYDVKYCPFNAIEQIKNGMVTEGKLKKKARKLIFAPPHVVIFSNDEPDTSKLSYDRWKIIRL